MYCQKCANKLLDDAKFCNKCGNPVNVATVAGDANPSMKVSTEDLVLPASILKRLSNFLIDRVASYIPLILCSMYFLYFPSTSDSGTFETVLISIAGVLFFAYHLICESIWQRTLGKLITKTKVVDKEGNKPSFLKILGRSLARYIPFEPLSFLFSGYPIGWHDSLSNTLVVPVQMTPEEVRKMNFTEIKNQKSNNAVATVIIVIVGLLVVIAIIGILSSVVLASLNSARQKASDAAIKSNLASLKLEAALYEDSNNSYVGLCKDERILTLLKSASKVSSQNEFDYTCNDRAKNYSVSVPKRAGGYLCIDDTTKGPVEISMGLDAEFSCPTAVSPSGANWFTYKSSKDGFSILFPEQPVLDSKENIPVESLDMTYSWSSYKADDDTTSFFVSKYIYSGELNITDKDEVLKAYLSSITDSKDTKLISSSYTYQSGNRALEFLIKSGGEMLKGRYVLVGQELYLLMVDYFPVNYDQKVYDNFINSFKTK